MSKLLINTKGLKVYFNPFIDDGINNLNNAINIIENLDIPAGFSHHTYLKTLSDTLKASKKDCVIVKDFVTNSIINFNNATSEINDLINNIEIISIKNRNSIIK